MSDLKEFRLPDVGEGLTEADIVRWLVKPGDTITVNQIIVEIETAKAVVELPSPYAGTVASLLVPEGDTADVGTPIISVDTSPDGSGGAPVPAEAREQRAISETEDLVPAPPVEGGVEPGVHGTLAPKPERQAVLVGYGVKLGRTTRRTRKAAPAGPAGAAQPTAAPEPHVTPAETGAPANGAGPGVLAKPPVRKMARDLGVDLSVLTGTGPKGSVTRDDVERAATSAPAGRVPGEVVPFPAATAPAGAREERIPIRGVRKHTAAAMSASAFTAPHVTEFR
jgi:2-oxoisovalerate dehydrogenase E2 component (dihydrolipoyl transacylase)